MKKLSRRWGLATSAGAVAIAASAVVATVAFAGPTATPATAGGLGRTSGMLARDHLTLESAIQVDLSKETCPAGSSGRWPRRRRTPGRRGGPRWPALAPNSRPGAGGDSEPRAHQQSWDPSCSTPLHSDIGIDKVTQADRRLLTRVRPWHHASRIHLRSVQCATCGYEPMPNRASCPDGDRASARR